MSLMSTLGHKALSMQNDCGMHVNNIVVYRWLSVIIYVVFLFLVITVLLNLLIAQMSDTYSNVQSDAQRSLVINRAWIVARVEHNTLLAFVRTSNNEPDIYVQIVYRIIEGETTEVAKSYEIPMVSNFIIAWYLLIPHTYAI